MPTDTTRPTVSRRTVLRRATAGAVLGTALAGAEPAAAGGCSVVVPDDHETVQGAVDAAAAGDTVCVRPGTYAEDVTVRTPVTLAGRTAPLSAQPALLDGLLTVAPDGAGTTVRRLRITPSETFPGGTFPDPAGVLVTASDVTVEDNVVEGLHANLSNGEGSFTLHGVQVFGDDPVAGVTVRGNTIRGFLIEGDPSEWPKYGGIAGVKLQADVADATVADNTVVDHHSAGWAWGVVLAGSASAAGHPTDVRVTGNHVDRLNDGGHFDVFAGPNGGRNAAPYPGSAFGIDGGAVATETTVARNDLLAPNGAESKDGTSALDASCNWWGDRSGPTHADNPDGDGSWAHERGGATVEYEPWLVAPSPSRACRGGSPGP